MADTNTIGGIHYDIMKRCYNPDNVMYKDYGAKGIKVCEEWHDRENFRQWAKENGYQYGYTLMRYDTSGNYCPENCKFVPKTTKSSGIGRKTRERKEHRKEMKEYAGITGKYTNTRLQRIHNGMLQRCNNKNDYHYVWYGARGITVCPEWSGKDGFFHFYKWAMDHGYQDDLSIDRIDNDKGYSPENCRWATAKEQSDNRRDSKLYEYNGEMLSLTQIADQANVNYQTLRKLVNIQGMTVSEAIRCTPSKDSIKSRPNKFYDYNGEKLTLKELSERTGIKCDVLKYRINKRGLSVSEATSENYKRKPYESKKEKEKSKSENNIRLTKYYLVEIFDDNGNVQHSEYRPGNEKDALEYAKGLIEGTQLDSKTG